jgi:molecular chaperone DnaK
MSVESEPALVVDLGDAACSAALVTGGEAHLVPEPVSGAYRWPSAVYWDGRQMLVGTLALHCRPADPAGFAVGFKRTLDSPDGVLLGADRFRPVEQVAAVLTALRLEASRVAAVDVRRALITVPAGRPPGDPRRGWLIAAAEAAGFATVALLPEPVASAHAPVAGPGLAEGDLVLVYDLGNSACQLALVRIGARVPQVLGHAVAEGCGGGDVDALLAARIAAADWVAGLQAPRERLAPALADFARRIRHQLSDAEAVEDYLLPDAPAYRLDRAGLAAVAAPLLDRTVHAARHLLARLHVPADRVATVLLTGGGARMPAVVEALSRAFGRPLRRVEEPELATVRGAARWLLHTGPRRVAALEAPGRVTPLAFEVPGGSARLLRWLVAPGAAYPAGRPLARVRLPDGALWDLTAAGGGTLGRMLVAEGADVAAGQWLALAYP